MDPVLVDMNLSADWVDYLRGQGFAAVHWSAVGPANALDEDIMDWAEANRHVVFTNDLGFARRLARSKATAPSVLQVRGFALMPVDIGPEVVAALGLYQHELVAGALVTVEQNRSRVRLLPIVP